MNWEQERAYFLPVAKDIGCGWICAQSADSQSANEGEKIQSDKQQPSGATIYILKLTLAALSEDVDGAPSWVKAAKEQFMRLVRSADEKKSTTSDKSGNIIEAELSFNSNGMEGIHLTAQESIKIRQVIDEAIEILGG